jgi:hypothetical protein
VAEGAIVLALDPKTIHDLVLSVPAPGVWELRTTGTDPFVGTLPFPAAPAGLTVLAFEYTCIGTVKPFEVFVGHPWSETRSQEAEELPYSEGWTAFALDLQPVRVRMNTPLTRLRLDFGRAPGRIIQVRNVGLRAPTAAEQTAAASRTARQQAELFLDRDLRAYVAASFPARITHVSVRAGDVEISGHTGGQAGALFLAESPVWQHLTAEKSLPRAAPIPPATAGTAPGPFTIVLPRRTQFDSQPHDRLFSRWVIVRAGAAGDERLSAARYADEVIARHPWQEHKPASKKGLGGFQVGGAGPADELETLGIDSITVNLFLARLFHAGPGRDALPFQFAGTTYYASRSQLEKLDRTLLAAARRGALVLGIILVPKAGAWDSSALGRVMQHPDCDPAGTYSMANVTSADGVRHYAAMLDFLAARYSLPGAPSGRIHHWIVHNEVDAGWVWTNCGEKPPVLYVDQYHKSMRIAHLVARQYDPHARAYVSLTHHWNATVNRRFIPSREILTHLLAFSRTEGDFDWGLAHHPYPESLFEPKSWLDRKATFAFDTPMITFKNLEVLDAWVKQPAHRYLGQRVRPVHLSEQGPNSRDYSPRALEEQAAGMAYAWKKLRDLDSIAGFQFHNWIDNRKEGGLRIGLRRFPDDPEAPAAPKPVWHLYRALGTPAEDAACAFALPLVGVRDWSEIRHTGPIAPGP